MEPLPCAIVTDPAAARHLLHPLRRRLLSALTEPLSAAELARSTGLPRQRIGYHLGLLEQDGLIALVGTRRKRNCEERVLRARALSFVSGTAPLERGEGDAGAADRFSWARLATLAARVLRDVATLCRRAERDGTRVQTLALETEIRFASLGHRIAFAQELGESLRRLHEKYDAGPGGDAVRVVCGAHPAVPDAREGVAARDGESDG